MIFLSAQPDDPYFIWQLEIQLINFKSFGIGYKEIHVLISYEEKNGINNLYVDFSSRFKEYAQFYFYPDRRKKKKYVSSIRPHIIAQHFFANECLSKSTIFYHDSDILFTHKLPDFNRLCADDIWYFSDAKSYLDSNYIKSKGEIILDEMCGIVGIGKQTVIDNDENAGGAQSLLKNVDYRFWEKIEVDSENLYDHLFENTKRYRREFLSNKKTGDYVPISSWCADMWALLWNSIKVAQVKIDKDLDFCWPHHDKSEWYEKKIFHNAGVNHLQDKKYFYKSAFIRKEPYGYDFSSISSECCSHKYLETIEDIYNNRVYDLTDVTFLIPIRIDSDDRLENLTAILSYLAKYFRTNVIILEADNQCRIPAEIITENIKHVFIKDDNPLFLREIFNNKLIHIAETDIIIKYDCDVIVSPSQLNRAVLSVRHSDSDFCYPYDGSCINVSGALRSFFLKRLDVRLIFKYSLSYGNFFSAYGGCMVINRTKYIQSGMDNEAFNGWAHEDQEIFKRLKILGFQVKRQEGPLFHLDHKRLANSNHFSQAEFMNSLQEYIKVCNMNKTELTKYISNWRKYDEQTV